MKYYVTAYGMVSGEEAMMSEILERGPITCELATPNDFCFGSPCKPLGSEPPLHLPGPWSPLQIPGT